MKRQKVVACALAVGLSGALFGATYTFPSGGGDLADLSKWQTSYPDLAALPGAGDTVKLGSSSTFTMSSDMTVGSFSFASQNAVLDFASSGNHTLKVMDAQHAFSAYDGTIKGGTIDRNGQQAFWFQSSGRETTVTDGCVVTNVSSFYVNVWGTSNGKVHLTGASRIHAGSLTVNDGLADTVCGGALLEVTDGSQVFTTSEWNFSDMKSKEAASGGNGLDVSGDGSAVTMAQYYVNGYHSHSNVLRVSDGGSFSSKALYVGFKENGLYSNGNKLIVDGGTVRVTGGSLYCVGEGNVIAVTNGVVDFKNKGYSFYAPDSTNTTVDIVNSTWKCSNITKGKSFDLHISGEQTEFDMGDFLFGLGGSRAVGDKVCLDDGFSWNPNVGYGYYMMENTTNCTMTVQNGACLSAWHPTNDEYDQLIFGGAAATDYGAGNVVNVLNGGTLIGKDVRLNGCDNMLVVSSGNVNANSSFDIGPSTWCSNNTVIVRGDSLLVFGGVLYLRNHSTLRIEVPESGYESGIGLPPITANNAYFQSNCTFEVDVGLYHPKESAEVTLMSFGEDLAEDRQKFLLSAELPPRYSLRIDNNRKLVLVAKGEPKPTTLIFR